jgi:3-oxoacyl-[acyl-carrier protein] reductase
MESKFRMLKDKVVIITGANRGIGNAIMHKFAEHRAIIYAFARKQDILSEDIQIISNLYHQKVTPVYFDIRDDHALKNAILSAYKEQGRLDCIVNNAGLMEDALIGMASQKNIQQTFEVNVFAVINAIQYAAKLMKRNQNGSIINLSSIIGTNGNVGQIVYSASKGAIISLTKSAAKELAPYGIRVNAIAPGMIDTDMFRSIGEEKINQRLNQIGQGRLGKPEEVADLALFLASDLSNYITGQIIGIDGSTII